MDEWIERKMLRKLYGEYMDKRMDGQMDKWMDWGKRRKREQNYQKILFLKKYSFGCVVFSCGTWDLLCHMGFLVHGLCSCGMQA